MIMSKSYPIHKKTEYFFLSGIAKEGGPGYFCDGKISSHTDVPAE